MTIRIKDIARLSGVSVSTVSKIMNHKADSIAESTKARVLQIAREHHYTPYSNIRQSPGARRYLLGLAAPLSKGNIAFIRHLEAAAAQYGYRLLISDPGESDAEAEKNLRLLSEATDGLIVLENTFSNELAPPHIDNKVPAVFIDAETADPAALTLESGWEQAARLAVEYLAGFGHRRIGLLAPTATGLKYRQLKKALEAFYSDREMVFDHKLLVSPESLDTLMQVGAGAIVCADLEMAALFYKFAWEQELMIPHDISVIALSEVVGESFLPPLSMVKVDSRALAENSVAALCALLEKRQAPPPVTGSAAIVSAESVSWPESLPGAASHILVVGTLNLDVVMQVPHLPSSGDLFLIDSVSSLPGGKGANQALGVAKLGGEVSLIGRIGRDMGGRTLYSALRGAGVNTKGISVDRQLETGRAYINVDSRGESFIEVYSGANQRLEKRHLERHEALFRSSRYCLIQSELPRAIYSQAVDFAVRNGSRVIFKPCSVDSLAPELLAKIHILIPNRKEAARLSGAKALLEQADFFLARGVAELIITLDEDGCFHANGKGHKYYGVYEEEGLAPVDTSGASDAFISALALSLAEGNALETAILYARVAAALSISQKGVQSSMPDRAMMELRKAYYLPN